MLLYETLSQPLLCFLFILTGFGSAFLFSVSHLLFLCFKQKKWVRIFLDFLTVFAVCTVFFFSLLFLHYGQLRLFLVLSFITGMAAQQILLKKILAKSCEKVYFWIQNKRKRKENGK